MLGDTFGGITVIKLSPNQLKRGREIKTSKKTKRMFNHHIKRKKSKYFKRRKRTILFHKCQNGKENEENMIIEAIYKI